ncbi:MAG TPA: hypothetical protein VHE11_04405 [Steroidobacteraceae bacterium]|nr:hypothetical protein [Steroidobacteraceae bacterium]
MDAQSAHSVRMMASTSISSRGRTPVTAADLFGLLWRALSDLLGSATTATLLRRSRNAVASRWPEVACLQIDREGLEYRYTLPASWTSPNGHGLDTMRDLVGELRPLLMELTGEIILSQLDTNPRFAQSGIVFSQ